MQQFCAIFRKELSGYFRSYFAYFVFFIYLSVSIGGAFYFGAYLAMHDTSVYALFYMQPAILVLLIPALTMRLWSDEYKLGTAEFLLTQPLPDWLPVLAKYAASVFFAVFMSLFLLPFIIYTSTWLKIDWGSICCSYLGLWLYVLLFCSIGCFISSLSKYTVISYLLTVFVIGVWLLAPVTKLYEIYNNFLFAEVGVSDFSYFVMFAVAFLCLNILVPGYHRSAQKNKNLSFYGFAILFIAGTALLNASLFLLLGNHKIDLTYNRQYTLAPITREILASAVKPVYMDVYISRDLKGKNAEYYYYYQQVKRFIEKYGEYSESTVNVNVMETEPFSELEKIALSAGLYYEENNKGTKDYFGAVIRDNEGQGVVIKQFLPQRKAFIEKDIDKALLKLTRNDIIKSVGIYFDPRQDLDKFNGFSLNLEEDYNVLNVSEDTYEISPKLDLLILVNPKELPVYFLYAVDQYIAGGGKVVLFFDLLTKGQSEETNLKYLQIVPFLDQMKVLLGEKLIDTGEAVGDYKISNQNLNLYKAMEFTADEKEFDVKPIIKSSGGYIGAVVSGQYKSAFEQNPHKSEKILQNMMPHTIYSSDTATVAFIGDVDIIENETWIDDNSPDQNPYSVIFKSSNMMIIRRLIDELVGNGIYNTLPQKGNYESAMGIGEQINAKLYDKYSDEYENISQDMKLNKLKLLQKSGGDIDKMQTLMQTDEVGLHLGEDEQKMEKLFFNIRKKYSESIEKMIFFNVFVWPLSVILCLGLLLYLIEKHRRKRIKEAFDE